ncbi:MAG: hypothetical protein RLZZ215_580 [Pseudomonadota bacterium]|jgi:hypothetical protein
MKLCAHFITLVVVAISFWITALLPVSAENLAPATHLNPPQTQTGQPLQVRLTHTRDTKLENLIYFALLKLALEKSHRPFEIKITEVSTSTPSIRMINNPELINVVWMGTAQKFEQQLWPVRIPLLRGLVGYKVLLIRKDTQSQFDQIKTERDLANFKALLGLGWVDADIFAHHQLPYVEGEYSSLMSMLSSGRADYYPRSIFEFNQELDPQKHPTIELEQSLLLHYPLAIYFFVAPNNHALHAALQDGLEKAMADSSYNQLLATHPVTRDVFKTLHLRDRRLITIDNPFLTEETRAVLAKYALDPQQISDINALGTDHHVR